MLAFWTTECAVCSTFLVTISNQNVFITNRLIDCDMFFD